MAAFQTVFTTKITRARNLIQVAFLGWSLYLGLRLAAFVEYLNSRGQLPAVERPTGVDAYLPIGALISLKNWLVNDQFDRLHPAALVLLLTFLALAFLTRKSFCAWICPVGAVSEGLYRSQERISRVRLRLWPWLDKLLMGVKYLLLLFFVKLIIDMPPASLQSFLASPYWALSDIKMLHFFTAPTATTVVVITILAVLSLFIRLFWCRYLCPYGALLGLFSWLSPSRIARQTNSCKNCGQCDRACPASLKISSCDTITSVECTGCLTCVQSCPQPETLHMTTARRRVPAWGFMLLVIIVFSCGVCAGMISGHWHSSLTEADYARLIPLLQRL